MTSSHLDSKDLLFAILAMDSYNRGYLPGIVGLGGPESKIGPAKMLNIQPPGGAEDANFYASAYELADGSKVISFRGKDKLMAGPGMGRRPAARGQRMWRAISAHG